MWRTDINNFYILDQLLWFLTRNPSERNWHRYKYLLLVYICPSTPSLYYFPFRLSSSKVVLKSLSTISNVLIFLRNRTLEQVSRNFHWWNSLYFNFSCYSVNCFFQQIFSILTFRFSLIPSCQRLRLMFQLRPSAEHNLWLP